MNTTTTRTDSSMPRPSISSGASDQRSDAAMRQVADRARVQDVVFHRLTQLFSLLVLIALVGIIASLFYNAWPTFQKFGFAFITTIEWDIVNEEFGAAIAVVGTLLSAGIAMVIAVPLAFGIALLTDQGRSFLEMLKEARVEARKIVWPSKQETWQTTLIVAGVVVAASLLLWLIDTADEARPLKSAFWRGWLAGAAYFGLGTWWIAEAFLVDIVHHGWMAPFAVTFMAGGIALFWGAASLAYRWIADRTPGGPGLGRVLVFAGVLAVFEWLRGHVLTGFPWNLVGETWRAGSAMSQTAALVGAYGLTWINLAMACAVVLWREGRAGKVAAGFAGMLLIALSGWGPCAFRPPRPRPPMPCASASSRRTSSSQPNTTPPNSRGSSTPTSA